MKCDVSAEQAKKATHPHELFLINLVFNHIFMFIVAMTVATAMPLFLLVIPILSISILCYIFWRANQAKKIDSWYVMCHWQIAARWSFTFFMVLSGFLLFASTMLMFHKDLGMSNIAMYAFLGGFGLLPTMVFILLLVAIESDSLHRARDGELPDWVTSKYPQTPN